ncbi:hypothetical protein GGI24_001297, partial [Coemansia furcata]
MSSQTEPSSARPPATGTTIHGSRFLAGRDSWIGLVESEANIVDKSLAIEHVVDSNYHVMIALAPRGSGKSTFLSMLTDFLALYSAVPKETRLEYFSEYDLYTKHRVFFDKHFAMYPVIHLDFL